MVVRGAKLPGWSASRWLVPAVVIVYLGLGAYLTRPLFRPGYPPGVDTPTFLHLSWAFREILRGAWGFTLYDPFWYGGFYVLGYPPLAFISTAVLSLATGIQLETAYKLLLLLSYVGLAGVTFWLTLEFHRRVLPAALAGGLTLLAYPLLAALGLWGWYTTLAALALGLASLAAMERAFRLRHSLWGLVAGMLLGLTVLTHFQTALAIAMIGGIRLLFQLLVASSRSLNLRIAGMATLGLAVITVWWLPLFIVNTLDAGFRREIPGGWAFPLGAYFTRIRNSSFIGAYIYPSYYGIVHLILGISGITYALLGSRAARAYGLGLVMFFVFSLGEQTNPVLRFYPLSGFDVSRFMVYMVPLSSMLGAVFLTDLLVPDTPPRSARLAWVSKTMAVLVIALALSLPLLDSLQARTKFVRPFVVGSDVVAALHWLREEEMPGRVLGVGFWYWDIFLVPAESGREHVAGWLDEATSSWRPVREIRYMMWGGNVDSERLHHLLGELGGRFVIIYLPGPAENPQAFLVSLKGAPELFEEVARWDSVAIFLSK